MAWGSGFTGLAAGHGRRMRAALGILAVFAVLAAASMAPARAQETPTPPFWRLEHEGATVWLLGTIHLLPSGSPYTNDVIDAAFAASDNVVFEIVLDQADRGALQSLVMQVGLLPPDRNLSDGLTEAERQDVFDFARSLWIDIPTLERFRPWLASLLVSNTFIMRAGYSPDAGVESQFAFRARTSGKPVAGFETPEEQVMFMANLPEDVQYRYLVATVRSLKEGGTQALEELRSAWFYGDLEKLEDLTYASAEEFPEMHDVIIVRRNRDWFEKLGPIIERGGTTFVAVGAGHLVGDDSLINMLQDEGYTVTRQ